MRKIKLAIFSPHQDAYSETFIHAHRNLPFEIKFYYGGFFPTFLEPSGSLFPVDFISRLQGKLNPRIDVNTRVLKRSLVNEKVDCILAEYGPTGCSTFEVARSLDIPMIVHFHGFDASDKDTISHYQGKYRGLFDYASKVVAVSAKMSDSLLTMGCPKEKIVVNTYGPDPTFLELKPLFSKPQFVAIGRFVDKKAPYATIIAFKEVVDLYPDAKLVMGGDGELLNACKNLSKCYGLQNNIEFRGILNPDEIKTLLQESLAFVQHSITADSGDSEGTPVAIMEAQAAGLPVISTFHAGIPDVVIHNETGLLVDELDIVGMTNNMISVLKDIAYAKKLGDAGKKRIITHFTLERHLNVLGSLIQEATMQKNES